MDNRKSIVLTRTEDQNEKIALKWDVPKVKFISAPLIQKIPLPFTVDLSICYDWLFFTSASAVQFFFEKTNKVHEYKIAAIGPKTAEALKKRDTLLHFVPSRFNAHSFMCEWHALYGKKNQSILFPQSKIGRLEISEGLTRLGHKVNVLPVYDTLPNPAGQKKLTKLLKAKENIIITLASPSAWQALKRILSPCDHSFQLGVIGSVTKRLVQSDGYKVAYQPTTFTMESLIELILKEIEKNESFI